MGSADDENAPLRVTLLAEYYLPRLGGVERFVDDLARALLGRGHAVRVLTTTPETPGRQGARVPALEAVGDGRLNVVRVPSVRVPAVGVPISPLLPRRLNRMLAAERTDVVHVHASVYSAGALAGAWAARASRLPTVVTFHSRLGRHAYDYRWSNRLTRWASWPHVLAGVSQPVADDVSRVVGRATSVLSNAVDVSWWAEAARAAPTEAVLRIVTVQRLKSRKRGAALLEAVAAAARRLGNRPRLEVTFVGDGPRRVRLERQAERLGVTARFPGAVPREAVRAALAASDVFVSSSDEEAFGLAAAEARAAGLPVIAFRTGSLPEIVPHGRAGLLVESDTEMADAIVRVAREDGLLARLRDGSAAAPPRYDWPTVVTEHERAYREAGRLSRDPTDRRR